MSRDNESERESARVSSLMQVSNLISTQPLSLILKKSLWRGCLLFNLNTKLMKKWPRQAREALLPGFRENPTDQRENQRESMRERVLESLETS